MRYRPPRATSRASEARVTLIHFPHSTEAGAVAVTNAAIVSVM